MLLCLEGGNYFNLFVQSDSQIRVKKVFLNSIFPFNFKE
ncbi:hypothetical protein B4129_1852 [Bacillus safensis]|nr:hypothetical protein B4129_1852 [Bacillus safensis]